MGVAALAAAFAAGCGGSSPAGSSMGPGETGSGIELTWKENGTAHGAQYPSAVRITSTRDMLQIAGGEAGGTGIAFGVVAMPPPLALGTFACGGAGYPIVTISYTVGTTSSTIATACSVTLTTLGDTTGSHVTGTFSATLPFSDGTTKTLTEGKFDLMQTVSSL
jgi:hypothetical protein